jgi:hypothetical protein
MSSLLKANWNRQAGGRAQVIIGMHAHPKSEVKVTDVYVTGRYFSSTNAHKVQHIRASPELIN